MFKLSISALIALTAPLCAQNPPSPTPAREKSHDGSPDKPYNAYPTSDSRAYDNTTVAGQYWLPDKGVMLTNIPIAGGDDLFDSTGRLDNRRSLPYDLGEYGSCYTLKFQQDYSTTDETAKPGTFTWTKNAGSSSFWDIDAAVRADIWMDGFYEPRGLEASLGLGYDIKKSDKTGEEVDLQSYHLSVPFVPNDLFFWIPFLQKADQVFQADFSYTRDGIADEDGFDFETDWEPVFVFPWENYGTGSSFTDNATKGFWVGVRCDADGMPLDPRKTPDRFFYHIDPNVGLSYGDEYSLGSPVSNIATELTATYSIGMEIGGPVFFGKRGNPRNGILVTLDYALKGGTSLTSDGDFTYQQAGLHFKPAQAENPVTLDLVYQKGENGFAQAEIEQFQIGLGMKF